MTTSELLANVKTALGITSDYMDALLMVFIEETLAYLKDAGVKSDTLTSDRIVGIVVRGVADLWNYGQGEGKLSPYFKERAIQLTLEG